MGLSAEQLQASVADCLNDYGHGPHGERIDYSGFNVEVEVLQSADKILQAAVVRQRHDA